MVTSIDDRIRVKQLDISVENDPIRKKDLQVQLQKLQLEREIEQIKKRIKQLG